MKIFRELKGIPEPEEDGKKTFFEQAEDAKNALEHTKTEEQTNASRQTEAEEQMKAEEQTKTEGQAGVSLEKGNFIDQVVDDQTASSEDHQE